MRHTGSQAEQLRRTVLGALVVHVGVGIASAALFLAAFQLRTDWFVEPARLLAAGPTSAELLRWAAAADLLSYYLPIAVVAYVVWRGLRPRSALVADLSFAAACAYVVAGGIGASILALVGPMLMHAYADPAADQAAIATAFGVITEIVYRAIWQFFDALMLGAWWLGIGALLRRDQPGFGRLSLGLGALAVVGAGFTVGGLSLARDAFLGIFFVGWLAWSLWLLALFWRRSAPFDFA